MCAVVDGYRLFQITESDGSTVDIVAYDHVDAEEIAVRKGFNVEKVKFHPLYTDYVGRTPEEKELIYDQILDKIYNAA